MSEVRTIKLTDNSDSDSWNPRSILNVRPVASPAVIAASELLDSAMSQYQATHEFASSGFDGGGSETQWGFSGGDGDLAGQPKPVADTTEKPWRYIGRLQVNFENGEHAIGTAVIIGRSTILTAAHNFDGGGADVLSAIFLPAVKKKKSESFFRAPYGSWSIATVNTPDDYKASDDGEEEYRSSMYYDYALCSVNDRYKVWTNNGTTGTEKTGLLADVVGGGNFVDGYLDLERDYLPREASDLSNIKLTTAGYSENYGDNWRMYRQTGRYMGSFITRNQTSHDPGSSSISMFQGSKFPQDAMGVQVFNSELAQGISGGAVMRRGPGGRYTCVGISVFGTGVFSYSPTFSTKEFKEFLEKYQAKG